MLRPDLPEVTLQEVTLQEVTLQEVTEPHDPRVAGYQGLRDSARRRRAEEAERVFVVEGLHALRAVLESPYPLLSVLVLRRRAHLLSELDLPPGTEVLVASDEVMEAIAGFDVHRGLLGLGRRLDPQEASQLVASLRSNLVLVVEDVNDQANLGSLFRNAAAFGAGAVFLAPTCADPLYRRSIRVSLGQVLRVPFARLAPWPAALSTLERWGFAPLALTPSPRAEPLGGVAAELAGQKVALVVGAEGPGLSAEVLGALRQVRIPIARGVDSLNVAAATAVALHCFAGLV